EPVAELGRELAAGIERDGALVHLARAVGVADLFVCLAEQQTRVLGCLGATRALEERFQRMERALEFLGLDARVAQVEPDHAVAHLGLQLHVAAEVLGSRVPVLAPVRGLACAARRLGELALHAGGPDVDGLALERRELTAVEMHGLRHGLVQGRSFFLAAEKLVDAEGLFRRIATRLLGSLDLLGILLQRRGPGFVRLRVAARGAHLGVGVRDRSRPRDHRETDVGGHAGHPVPLLLLLVPAAHLLELGMQVLEQVVGLDDEVACLDQLLAQRGDIAVAASICMGRKAARRGGLVGHRHHAPLNAWGAEKHPMAGTSVHVLVGAAYGAFGLPASSGSRKWNMNPREQRLPPTFSLWVLCGSTCALASVYRSSITSETGPASW